MGYGKMRQEKGSFVTRLALPGNDKQTRNKKLRQ